MREIVHAMISGNPYIKAESKPTKSQIMNLTIDNQTEKEVTQYKKVPITPEEIEQMKKRLMDQINK